VSGRKSQTDEILELVAGGKTKKWLVDNGYCRSLVRYAMLQRMPRGVAPRTRGKPRLVPRCSRCGSRTKYARPAKVGKSVKACPECGAYRARWEREVPAEMLEGLPSRAKPKGWAVPNYVGKLREPVTVELFMSFPSQEPAAVRPEIAAAAAEDPESSPEAQERVRKRTEHRAKVSAIVKRKLEEIRQEYGSLAAKRRELPDDLVHPFEDTAKPGWYEKRRQLEVDPGERKRLERMRQEHWGRVAEEEAAAARAADPSPRVVLLERARAGDRRARERADALFGGSWRARWPG